MTRTIHNPTTGERIEFRESSPDVLRLDYFLDPDGFGVGRLDHVHPKQEERFEVRAGRLGVRVDGDEWTATPGTRFAVLPETPHTVWNDGTEEMHAVIELRPSLEIASFFETAFGLAREGKTNGWGLPGPLQLAVLADAFREEFAFAALPRPLQRGVASGLAPIGRLVGRRAEYDRFRERGPTWRTRVERR